MTKEQLEESNCKMVYNKEARVTHKDEFITEKQIVSPNGLLPISRITFLNGVKEGIYPQPIRFSKKKFWLKRDILKIRREGTK